MRLRLLTACLCVCFASFATAAAADYEVTSGGATIAVSFIPDSPSVAHQQFLCWLQTASDAVSKYYGRFPTHRLIVKLLLKPGEGVGFSTTGFEHGHPVIQIPVGVDTTAEKLKESWVATHEMTHLAFPMVHFQDRWVAEGQATYIEPIARLQVGDQTAEAVWKDLATHLPSGLPRPEEDGLSGSHRIARIYWGGALYCLLADIAIRKQTQNRKGFQDAVAAILQAGGNCGSGWSVRKALSVGDRAVGGHTLIDMYNAMKDAPVDVDLADLWRQLGVKLTGDMIEFDNGAPLSAVREAIEHGGERTPPGRQ